ncbi:MAG: alpha-glucosidase [Micavibrio aeruginosavorus]|uniref:Alpha-glucosidase n=1 Tax=Micavibrio aeruginosavorus TaxID=349221 RepID=A0A2W4ZY89_9BACT|nr:MAG: alpha-glucosidase [Micavibrio aeruginosavorus]
MSSENLHWWRGAVIYQIYPRSFRDTNGDGVGDIKGITEKLPYIADLGVDAVWISPVMKSPMKDFGYDVSDYQDIDPLFGTLDDFKAMLDKAHSLNLKIIIDMIYSHTSDQHVWFQESRKSRDNAKADWYVWADPKEDGTPPNNWVSVFGGSSWQYDSWRGQYYLHNFLKEQPDLNFHNADVQDAVLAATRFWLDLGVDGFRLDAINFAVHDKKLRDNPKRPVVPGTFSTQLDFVDPYSMQWHKYDKSQPEMLEFLKRVRRLLEEYPGTMALGEIGDDDQVARAIEYSAPGMLHTCYNFSLVGMKARDANAFRDAIEAFESHATQAWPAWAFSNHDVTRVISRWAGDFSTDSRIAKLLPALLASQRGSSFLYQGEELGLPDTVVAYDDIQDPWGIYLYPKWQGRDGCRTPMPWNADSRHLGFSDGDAKPWLPVNETYGALAPDRQAVDPDSTLSFVKAFLGWRKGQAAITGGSITFEDSGSDTVLIFRRGEKGAGVYCAFNLGDKPAEVSLPGDVGIESLFTWKAQSGEVSARALTLPPFGFFYGGF